MCQICVANFNWQDFFLMHYRVLCETNYVYFYFDASLVPRLSGIISAGAGM